MEKYIEISIMILGLIQGYLALKNKKSNWIAYIIQMVLYIIYDIMVALYGDVANSVVYFIMGIIGIVVWNKKQSNDISFSKKKVVLIYLSIMILSTIGIYFILNSTNDPLPFLDSLTTTSSFLATYLMVNKKIDTWIIWFFNDILYCVEYFLLPNQAWYLFGLNIIWVIMAVVSYLNWKKIMNKKHDNVSNSGFTKCENKI